MKHRRNGADWWAQFPDRLGDLMTLVPGVLVAVVTGWVLLGAVKF